MKKSITHRKIAGIASVLLAGVLLMTGTFAWYAGMSQVNEFIGTPVDKEIVLHDDYDPETGDKAVYIENAGSGLAFVRVKLDEFMDLTQSEPPEDIGNLWVTHIPGSSLENCDHENDAEEAFHDYFTWFLGGQKYFMPGEAGEIVQDLNDYDPSGGYYQSLTSEQQAMVKQTSPSEVITITQYQEYTEAEKTAFVGWIYDTDGYAYWSQPLVKGQTTGLLLNKVKTSNTIYGSQEYYYAINVIVEAVDYKDLNMWIEGAPSVMGDEKTYENATDDAINVLNFIKEL